MDSSQNNSDGGVQDLSTEELRELRQADGGLGITGMKERARHVGGRVEISSEPGRGTQVQISLPVAGEAING